MRQQINEKPTLSYGRRYSSARPVRCTESLEDRGSASLKLFNRKKASAKELLPRDSIHIPALDGIRGAAAAAVFIYHYGGGAQSSNEALRLLGETIHLGWVGVSLFFVLSGFLISGILLDSLARPGWCKTFYIRRALRIFPLYYGALVGAIVIDLLFRAPSSSIFSLWPFFLYLQDIPGVVRFTSLSHLVVFGHFWSLAVEEQFYLVWPFLISFADKRNKVRFLCLSVWVLSLIFRIWVFSLRLNWQWAGYFIGGRAGEMAAGGFLAASLRASDWERGRVFRYAKSVLALSIIGVVGIVILTRQTGAGDPWFGTLGAAFLSLLFAALISLSLRPGWIQQAFTPAPLRWLGKISYGVYVYHLMLYPFFAWLTRQMLPDAAGNVYLFVLCGVAMVGTLSVASLSFAVFETPFLRLKNSLGERVYVQSQL